MMQFLKVLDKWANLIVTNIIGIGQVVITFVIFLQVLARYFIELPFRGLDELAVYTMIATIWLAGIVFAREDNHIKIEILELFIKNKQVHKWIKIICDILIFMGLIIFTKLSFDYLQLNISNGEKSPSMEIPMWWVVSFIFISSLGMTIYYLYIVIRGIRKWN